MHRSVLPAWFYADFWIWKFISRSSKKLIKLSKWRLYVCRLTWVIFKSEIEIYYRLYTYTTRQLLFNLVCELDNTNFDEWIIRNTITGICFGIFLSTITPYSPKNRVLFFLGGVYKYMYLANLVLCFVYIMYMHKSRGGSGRSRNMFNT